MDTCGLWFRAFKSDCGDVKLSAMTCKHPLCIDCARERVRPLQKRVLAMIRAGRGKGRRYKFLTLTVRNVPAISRLYVDRLIQNFGALRAEKLWVDYVLGGVYATDTTYLAQGWHVHLHVLVEVEGWLPAWWVHSIKALWLKVTGDSFVVNMRSVNLRAVKELIKYQAKSASFAFAPALVDEYLRAFHGVRRIQGFGSMHGSAVEIEACKPWRCTCGLCTWKQWKQFMIVNIRETELAPSGERRLRLALDTGPPLALTDWPTPIFPLSNPAMEVRL